MAGFDEGFDSEVDEGRSSLWDHGGCLRGTSSLSSLAMKY